MLKEPIRGYFVHQVINPSGIIAHEQKSLLHSMAAYLLTMEITCIKIEKGQMIIWKTFHK